MKRTIPLGLLLSSLLLPAAARAQAAGAEPPPVAPGSAAVEGPRLRPATASFDWLVLREGQEQKLGTVTDELTRTEHEGRPALLRVQTIRRGPGVVVDSTLTSLPTLAPVRHRSHQPNRTVALDFHGAHVVGAITPRQGAATRVDTTFAAPLFDSGNWDLVVRSLPLREGYSARLAAYDPDGGGQVWYTVRVTGRERAGGAGGPDAWRVETDLGRSKATLWIAPDTRDVLLVEVSMGPGVTLRLVRL